MAINLESLLDFNASLTTIVNQISLSLLILLIGFILGKLAERFLTLILRNSSFKQVKIFLLKINTEKLIPKLIAYVFYIAGLIFALSYSGILNVVILILLVIFSIAVIVSGFYAIKEIIPNFIARMHISRITNFKLRRKIKIDNVLGEISEINYHEVKITTESGDEIHIPCKVFLEKDYEIIK